MSKRWVIDASPLILLNKINHLALLSKLSEALIVPKAVSDELLSYEEDRAAWETFFLSTPKVVRLKAALKMHTDVSGWGLGKGESEVISYAMANKGCEAVLDDLEARKCATTFNIPLRGTVGIILLAKKNNILPAAKPLIEALKVAGLRFSDDWINGALNLVGEE